MVKAVLAVLATVMLQAGARALVIDHHCIDLARVPAGYLQKARQNLKVAFGHGPLTDSIMIGMQALKDANPVLYGFSSEREAGKDMLSLWNQVPSGAIGNPDVLLWSLRTDKFLASVGKDRNVMIWAWSSYLGKAQRSEVQKYLKQMVELEKKYPTVKFVYMTGVLDGSGPGGTLNKLNDRIRKFCRENDRILFDLADIQAYSPFGKVNYVEHDAMGDGSFTYKGKRYNWAEEWLRRHPGHNLALPAKVPYCHPLIANLEARAFWWMMACLAGWKPEEKTDAKTGEETPELRPVPRAAGALTGNPSGKGQTLLYRFDKIQDYRYWTLFGAKGTLIPEQGPGMLTPLGKPALAVHRGLLCVQELEFKARLDKGDHLNWYINTDWTGSLKPAVGLGGIFSAQGCMLLVNGTVVKLKNPVAADRNEHRFQIWIKDNRLHWAIDRKSVVEQEIPEALANHSGTLAIGGWNANVRINGVFVKSR